MVLVLLQVPLCGISSVASVARGVVVTVVNHDSLAVNNLRVLFWLLRLLLDESEYIPPDVLRDVSNFATELVDDETCDDGGAVFSLLAKWLTWRCWVFSGFLGSC